MSLLDDLLSTLCDGRASDLHLQVGVTPRYRVDGQLVETDNAQLLTEEDLTGILRSLLTADEFARFQDFEEIDFSRSYRDIRMRCNGFHDHWGPSLAMRRIPEKIPTLEELFLPEDLESFAHLRSGLVLITGATGSGKSSTLASLINVINENYARHILILEDPIEYFHQSRRSIVHQRAMGRDFTSFHSGLEAALREDPDVLLVGELRDLESIRLALTAAEMGMLVFSTLHTLGAAQSIDRIYDVFPAAEQGAIRTMVSHSLEGVVSQVLLRRLDEPGRVPATEVLVCTSGVRNLIREGKTQELNNNIQSGKEHGMHTLADSLERLVRRGHADPEEALAYSRKNDRLEKFLHTQVRARRRTPTQA